jgi:hypothetical protein
VTLQSAERFDPATNTFTPTLGSPNKARKNHTATLLPNGRVLLVGGRNQANEDLSKAELYDPATDLFSYTGSMNQSRALHTANLLPGGKVLFIGGVITGGDETPTSELYDPATGTFAYSGLLKLKRKRHTATLLPDGTVVAAGGNYLANSQGGGDRETNTAELYNPATGLFASVQNMNVARSEHDATLLFDGTVLISGGVFTSAVSDLYHPDSATFSAVGRLNQARGRHRALLLADPIWGALVGKVLIIGGDVTGGTIFGGAQQALDSVEIYDPITGLFSNFGTMTVARQNHTATQLPDGRILIAGGVGRPFVSGTAELVTP